MTTFVVDQDDPALGFAVEWIRRLVPNFDRIIVVTNRVGRHDLPESVEVHETGSAENLSQWRMALRVFAIYLTVSRHYKISACFAHMHWKPVIAIGLLLRLKKIPITVWYAHKSVHMGTRLVGLLANRIVTASDLSFRLSTRKKLVLGHGIDTRRFAPRPFGQATEDPSETVIVSISRLSPSKNIVQMLELAECLVQRGNIGRFRLDIYGAAVPGQEDYAKRLEAIACSIPDCVRLCGPAQFSDIPSILGSADLSLNFSVTGSVDKAVLESMSCATPVLTSNEAFAEMLSSWRDIVYIQPFSVELAAERIEQIVAMSKAQKEALGNGLRDIVVRDHDLGRLIGKLDETLQVKRDPVGGPV